MTPVRGGGSCATCGTEIDRRSTHCREHRQGWISSEQGRKAVQAKTELHRKERWMLAALETLPVGTRTRLNPTTTLRVLVEPLAELPERADIYQAALAYARQTAPQTPEAQRTGFACVLHELATGMPSSIDPPCTPSIEQGVQLATEAQRMTVPGDVVRGVIAWLRAAYLGADHQPG